MKNPLVSKNLEDYFGQGWRCDLKLKEIAAHKLSGKRFWLCLWKPDQKEDIEIKNWQRIEGSALPSFFPEPLELSFAHGVHQHL